MTTLSTIVMLAAMAAAAQTPEPWKTRFEAAEQAEAAGDMARTEAILTGIVRDAERLGDCGPRLAEALEWLAHFHGTAPRKRYAEADPMLVRALAIREKAPGPDRGDLADTLVDLAILRMCAKTDRGTSEPMLRRALAILDQPGRDDDKLARALRAMATCHESHVEYDRAEPLLGRAMAIQRKVHGPESAEVARLLADLGDLWFMRAVSHHTRDVLAEIEEDKRPEELPSTRHYNKAKGYYEQALAMREKVLKPDDRHIADSLHRLANLACEFDHPDEVVPYLTRWLAIDAARKSPSSEERIDVLVSLAKALKERKDWAGSEAHMMEAQSAQEALRGPVSNAVAYTLSERALVAIEASRFDDAERFIRRSLEIRWPLLKRPDSALVQARQWMSVSYRDHLDDRRAPMIWCRLKAMCVDPDRPEEHREIEDLLWEYAELLLRSNRVLPSPTQADCDYLGNLCNIPMYLSFIDSSSKVLVSFSQDRFDDAALAHVARLYAIKDLDIVGRGAWGDVTITDAGLAHLKNLINLRDLSIRGAFITDAGLAHLSGLENLEHLDLTLNPIGDAALVHLKGLKKIQWLSLSATNVTDAGLAHLEALPNLEQLYVFQTRMTRAALDRFRKAHPHILINYRPGPGYRPLPRAAEAQQEAPHAGR